MAASPSDRAWQDRSVFLTGATGAIGTALVRDLTSRGAKVRCLVRRPERAKHLADMGCTVVPGDVTRPDTIDLGDASTVIHAAAWVAMWVPKQKWPAFHEVNVQGAANMLDAALAAGIKHFCHVSSVAAIGGTPSGLYDEDRAVEGRAPLYFSPYERTKHEAHVLVLERHGKMRTVLPMPGVVVGRGSGLEWVLERYAAGKMRGLVGDNPTGMVHIRDTIGGIRLAIERGDGPYILVDQNVTFNQFLQLCEKASGIPAPKSSVRLGTLDAVARVVQPWYALRGKVPPISRAVVRSMEVPMMYSARRAVEELGWRPDLVGRLGEDLEGMRRPP